MLQLIDEQEHKHYDHINSCLKKYDCGKSNIVQDELISDLYALHQQLKHLQVLYADSVEKLDKIEPIYCHDLNLSLVPTEYNKFERNLFFHHEYLFFLNEILDFTQLERADCKHVKSYIAKIMSRSLGQKLIYELNAVKKINDQFSIKLSYGKMLSVCSVYSKKSAIVHLHYPKNFHEQPLKLHSGKEQMLIYPVPFILFAHELIHVLHLLKNTFQRVKSFHELPTTALSQLYFNGLIADTEEFHTIEDKNSSLTENKLRHEHNLPYRSGHLFALPSNQHDITKLCVLVNMRQGKTDFSSVFFPKHFKPPQFLDIEKTNLRLCYTK